ncbi:hypothetical protein BCR34DRAFT_607048 [Clohesyomyces aquaticus]|uniref:Heterokaryon incompatibility domain-containing protein n=1 Tax=Clohesyomyces aquaticus TaxID=1231657 RepID=A0A1Y1YJA3_9PLEO|nr:hypothetical protein BCR34DRAFT_607048 [Clohesyomyces aquaticus]
MVEGQEGIAQKVAVTPDREWANLKKLYRRTYFRRVWMTQEIAVNKEVDIICGKSSLPWDSLDKAIENINYRRYLFNPASNLKVDDSSFDCIQGISYVRKNYQQNISDPTGIDFLDILDMARKLQATDPRDKVFAMVRFRGKLQHIMPDYGISVTPSEVFKNMVQSFIEIGSLDIILHCGRRQQPNIPSWCPD